MKKNKEVIGLIIGLILIGILIILGVGYIIYQVQQKKVAGTFKNNGYIIHSIASNTSYENKVVEKYYFKAGKSYQKKYPNAISFQDTTGEKIVTSRENFIHYSDESMGALTKGVILNLDELNNNPFIYYNTPVSAVLNYQNNLYTIDNMGKQLRFKRFIWKISETKYLISADEMKLHLGENNETTASGYLEIDFVDQGVIRLVNQKVTYQTIASNSYIVLGEDIKIDLEQKRIYQKDTLKLNLGQMVINADDNVEIVPQPDSEEEPSTETIVDKEEAPTAKPDQNPDNYNPNQPGGNQTNQNVSNSFGSSGNSSLEDTISNDPKFSIQNFVVTSIKMDAAIEIRDEYNLLSGPVMTKVIQNGTGKVVYEEEEQAGTYHIDLLLENLDPDTEYTLIVSSKFAKNGIESTREFISKVFRTQSLGIEVTKSYATNDMLAFQVKAANYSKVKSAELLLKSKKGEVLQGISIDMDEALKEDGAEISFYELMSDTEYTVELTNIFYDNAIIANQYAMKQTTKTLKNKPVLGMTKARIDKKQGKFVLSIDDVKDDDHGVKRYRYELYEARSESSGKPVKTFYTDKAGSIDVVVDDSKIFRGMLYAFKVVAEFHDNEKVVEYETPLSEVFSLDGVTFPTLKFEEKEVTFERISGLITIEDPAHTVSLRDEHKITIVYTNSTGQSESFTTTGSLIIPFDRNNLRANETYAIAVYATVDLQDGNPSIDSCYIGSMLVQTKKPKEFVASFESNTATFSKVFDVKLQLGKQKNENNELEASTLTGLTVNLYQGQVASGTPVKSVELVDTDIRDYYSELKKQYYDNQMAITPAFFGGNNSDFTADYYTIEVTNAYDYTRYKNNLPIVDRTYTVKSNGYIPDIPDDVDNAVSVSVIRNRDDIDRYRAELKPETIIGYRVTANYNNAKQYAKYIKYYVYNADTGKLIDSETQRLDVDGTGVIPSHKFYLEDGTDYKQTDTVMRRGNRYYFAYEAYLDLDGDGTAETKYPYTEDGEEIILRSNLVLPAKQEPMFTMYPATSDTTTMTWNYTYQDIDHSLLSPKIDANINDVVRSSVTITETTTFKTATFKNLLAGGYLKLNVQQALFKTDDDITTNTLSEQYYDGQYTLPSLQYHTDIDGNRVSITILNYEAYQKAIARIAALKVVFRSSNGKTLTKDYLPLVDDMVNIDLYDLKELLNQYITITVYAYYDSGATGYDLGNTPTALQVVGTQDGGGEYVNVIGNNLLQKKENASSSIYNAKLNDKTLQLTNLVNQEAKSLKLTLDQKGWQYDSDYLVLKGLTTTELSSDGSNVIYFDTIIPGISLMDSNQEMQIVSKIDSAEIKMKLYGSDVTPIQNNTIYLEVYKMVQSSDHTDPVKTVAVKVADIGKTITIPDLDPKTDYYFNVVANILVGDHYEKRQLYDIDFKSNSKQYYFSTLSNIEISQVSTIYVTNSYTDKYLSINYTLGQVLGYDEIRYRLYKKETNETGTSRWVAVDMKIPKDEIFSKNMAKQLPMPPGASLDFNGQYMIQITPIAYITGANGEQDEIELGTVRYEFTFPQITKPFVGITSVATSELGINFKISINDVYKMIKNGVYTIQVLDQEGNDVTPEIYQDVKFDSEFLNQEISLDQLEQAKEYTLVVTTYIDPKNDGVTIQKYVKQYTASTIDDSGIDIGTVTSISNSQQRSKIDLVFYNSYRLYDIDQIRYSIYNFSGYAQNNTLDFTPSLMDNENERYYWFTLDESLPTSGKYYIEVQFLKEGQIVKTKSLEHVYTS